MILFYFNIGLHWVPHTKDLQGSGIKLCMNSESKISAVLLKAENTRGDRAVKLLCPIKFPNPGRYDK